MFKKLLLITLVIILFGSAVSAAVFFLFPYNPINPPKVDDSNSTQQRVLNVVDANNKFALDLYSELNKKEPGNIFFSPYSIFSALAMTYEGARGKTADEIQSVFYFPENEVLRPNFAKLYNDINKAGKDYQLSTGNALWVQKDFSLLEDYKSVVEEYYGGKAVNLDFINETEKSRQTINNFIEQQTNNKIKDLIPNGLLNTYTRLVLTNAIYFKDTWQWEFKEKSTADMDFKIKENDIVKVPMMYMNPEKTKFNYFDNDELQMLEMPYKGDDLSMLVILPKEDINSLFFSADKLKELKSKMEETKLDAIYFPKFEVNSKYSLNENLKNLGMPTAFGGGADFSGMDGKRDLLISDVIHQAYVKVDEKGTEAAAATAVVMNITSAGPANSKFLKQIIHLCL